MANPNKLTPKIATTVIIVTGQANAAGFSAPLFVSEFAANASFLTRIKSYTGNRTEKDALLEADGFAEDGPVRRQVRAAMNQDGPPVTIWIGRRDALDADWGETLDAIAAENSDDWYALCVDGRDSADVQQVSAWVEPPGSDPKFALYIGQTDSVQVRDDAPGNFAGVIAALGRDRTALLWHDPVTASGFGPATVTTRTGPFVFGASESLEFRFDGGATQSFAFVASPATLTGSNTETFDLSAGGTLTLAANGLASQDVDFTSTSATLLSAASETYDLEPGDTLLVRVDGGASQPATFDAAAAVDLGTGTEPFTIGAAEQLDLDINGSGTQSFVFVGTETTAQNVADLINATASGFVASDVSGAVELRTDRRGTGASVEVLVSSTAGLLVELGLPVGTESGTGDVANIDAVTAAEIASVVTADIAGASAADEGGAVRITAASIGTGSRLNVIGGNVNAALQFSTAEDSGTGFVNATAVGAAEVSALINASVAGQVASVAGGAVVLTSNVLGTSSAITVTAGAVATTLGLAAGTVAGAGDFGNAAQAQASEIAVVIGATIVDGTVTAPSSTVQLASATSGPTSSVEILTDSVGLSWSGDGFAVGTGTDEDYADCAWVGRCITFALDAENGVGLWDNQNLNEIEPDNLKLAQRTSLEQRRVNTYTSFNGRPETHWGTSLRLDDPTFYRYISEVTTADWIDARFSEAMNDLLNSHANQKTKMRLTDEDARAKISVTGRRVLQTAERNGHSEYDGSELDLTSDTDTGVFFPRVADLTETDINLGRYAGIKARQNILVGTRRINTLIELQRPPVQL
jgi:hypothetical protein